MREETWGAAFVGLDMRLGMADCGLIGLTQMRKRHAVGGRPIEDEKHLGIVIEQLTDGIR
jgi:hypothetical protein